MSYNPRRWLAALGNRLLWGTREVPTSFSEVRRSLRISNWEGALATVHVALTQGVFLTNYGQDLGLRDLGMGLLDAIPYLCQCFAFASPLIVARFGNRRQVVLYSALLHRLVWIGLIALLWIPTDLSTRTWLLLAMMTVSYGLAAIGGNAWTS